MKRITALLLLAATLLLCACSKPENIVPNGMKQISDDDADYYLYIPESWNKDTNMGVPAAYCNDTTYGDDFANISFVAFSGEESPESFWEKNLESLKSTFNDIEFETENEKTLIADSTAVKYVYTANVTGNVYKYLQVAIYHGGYVYLFTYTAQEKYFTEHYGDSTSDVDMMLENLKFK